MLKRLCRRLKWNGGVGVMELLPLLAWSLLLSQGSVSLAAGTYVRNSSLNERGSTMKEETVRAYRERGIKCPDAKEWPNWWSAYGNDGAIEFPHKDGVKNDSYARLSGKETFLTGYHGHELEERNYIYTVWLRGKGRAFLHVISFGKDEAGKVYQLVKVGEATSGIAIHVDSVKWIRYRHLLVKTPKLWNVHPWLCAREGTVEVDEVDIYPSNPALDLIVAEEARLYDAGALVVNVDMVAGDEAFRVKARDYAAAIEAFRKRAPTVDTALAEALEKEIARLSPYVLTQNLSAVQAMHFNEMLALTRVLQRLAGQVVGDPKPVNVTETQTPIIDHKPGIRKPRRDTVTITDIRSNKVRYDENETATTKLTIVNTSTREYSGTLLALMHSDLDTTREITRTPFAIGAGETKTWSFSYSVGPQTYGRSIEVRFVDDKGYVIDSWQEFYAVAAEWFRVHQHTHGVSNKLYEVNPWVTYFNQRHWFASEPTDFGVHTTDAEIYISGQAGYQIHQAPRKVHFIDHDESMGIKNTFYQNVAFCGQMGYEELRKHPEYALYDENGQFAVDPIYGGYPNPMELASPIEIGPKRKVDKPYLDRKYTPWQHCHANLALEEVVVYQAERIKRYAKEHGFDGVFIDGNMGVWKGYGYDGKPNVPSGKPEDYARLNARNHRIFSDILKKDDPNFGIWYNWGYRGIEWGIGMGLTFAIGSGSGAKNDFGSETIRAATAYKNIMLLNETGSFLQANPPPRPGEFLQQLIEQRDFAVQKWGANTIIGYSFFPWKEEEPGPAKWAWPTVNYLGAQLIATQMHYAGGFLPSWRPTLQFMTRYSRFIWAPDVKVVKDEQKVVRVVAPEEVWWRRLVYRRETTDGYDLIVHLVRIPPTERWDYNWVDEPQPLKGVRVTVNLGTGKLQQVRALRPYHFDEEQQPVETLLRPNTTVGAVSVEVPPFRYHTMIVFRICR